jgi:hypothetical protein
MNSAWFSLGYWLADPHVAIAADGQRGYGGLDRRLNLPGPGEDARLESQGRGALVTLRDRYWDLEDAGAFRRDATLAIDLPTAFHEEGIAVDLVLAELVELPAVRDVPDDLAAMFERQLARWSTTASFVNLSDAAMTDLPGNWGCH